jgi:hypothetical protein
VGCVFLLFYSIHDKTSFYLRGFQIYLSPKDFYFPARVRIWVISTVTAPNKHKSCTNCSSRTKSVVTVKMGLYIFLYIYIYIIFICCFAQKFSFNKYVNKWKRQSLLKYKCVWDILIFTNTQRLFFFNIIILQIILNFLFGKVSFF